MWETKTHTLRERFSRARVKERERESKGAKRTLLRRGKRRKLRFILFSFCLDFV